MTADKEAGPRGRVRARRVRVVALCIALAGSPFPGTAAQAGGVPAASGPECVPVPGMPCPGDVPSSSGSGTSTSSSGGRSPKSNTNTIFLNEMQKSIDQMFTPNPETLRKIRETRQEGDRANQESQTLQQQAEEQRAKRAAQEAEAERLRRLQELGKALGVPGSGEPAAEVDLRPGGTSFFGLGGGPGPGLPSQPYNDPMVVDLRHLRRATWIAQAVETSTTAEVPAILEKAFGTLSGEIPDLPPGAAAPAVDGKGLEAFRKAYVEYAGTRAALARTEAALKEARERRQRRGGPEADIAWEKAKMAYDAAKERAYGSREEAVRVLRALGQGRDPDAFRPPIPSVPAVREETWLGMQKRMMDERAASDALLARTQKELQSAVPPPKGLYRKVHEGVVLGFNNDAGDAERMKKEGASCFSNGKTYASMIESADRSRAAGREGVGAVVVAFGTPKGENGERTGLAYGLTESGRVVGDHFTGGAISLNTPQARKALEEISGKEFDRLVAHSNGATVAEALIREDRIRVNELNVVGGDMSLAKRSAYQELVDSGKVRRIVVWVNPADPVVWGTSIAPLEMMANANQAVESLARKIAGGRTDGVEYRFLPPGAGAGAGKGGGLFAPHFLRESYYPAIAGELGVETADPGASARRY